MHHDEKFDWTLDHQAVFISLKGALIQTPILHYPGPLKRYSLHTCLRWCLQCSAVIGRQQSRITNSIPFTHIHRHSTKIGHSWTSSLWHLLCYNKMEILSPVIWHHNTQWPQTLAEAPQRQEHKQGKSKVNIQHHLHTNITCMKQGSRLSTPVSWSSKLSSSHQHPHQHSCSVYTKWTLMDTMLSADIPSPSP